MSFEALVMLLNDSVVLFAYGVILAYFVWAILSLRHIYKDWRRK